MLDGASLAEPVALDGFETFEYSQFFPYHLNLAVGKESWFIYHFTDSPLRRKGRMMEEQKRRRAELESLMGRPDPKAVETGMRELIQSLFPLVGPRRDGSELACAQAAAGANGRAGEETGIGCRVRHETPVLVLHTDEHPAYGRAVRQLGELPGAPALRHILTPSTKPRTRASDLFPVNLSDLLLRHCGAGHRRETISYDKRRQGGLERAAIFTVWRNTIKWRQENKPGQTAATQAGILTRRLRWSDIFARRLFPRERELPGSWWEYYWRRVKTVALGKTQTENRARYAF
jgi:hypothetical protein